MPDLILILLRAMLVVATIIVLTRLHGLRSFSKMSSFDFAITVSIGSVLAGAVTTLTTGLWVYLTALAFLFLVQFTLSRLRIAGLAQGVADNAPLLVMENGKMLKANMDKGGMTENDLWAKLREANAFDLDKVQAVIMESTGDVSVLHGDPDTKKISPEVMQGVSR